MSSYWCVNFMDEECLTFGLREKLWLMGYQYDRRSDSPQWKATCTANWRKLQEIDVGDQLVAYVPREGLSRTVRGPGFALFAAGTVIEPRRPPATGDKGISVDRYLSQEKLYKSGKVYFSDSVAYENFNGDYKDLPVRIDVKEWDQYVPDGVFVPLDLTRGETVRAAFKIGKPTYASILKELTVKSRPDRKSRRK